MIEVGFENAMFLIANSKKPTRAKRIPTGGKKLFIFEDADSVSYLLNQERPIVSKWNFPEYDCVEKYLNDLHKKANTSFEKPRKLRVSPKRKFKATRIIRQTA